MDYEFKDHSKEALEAEKKAVEKALMKMGMKAEGYAKRNCPVDTGRLRNSITYATSEYHSSGKSPAEGSDYSPHARPDNNDVYIGTNVEYAVYVEFNDRAAHEVGHAHFLRNAATDHTDEYKRILESALKGKN